MGLTDKKEAQLKRMPLMETQVARSRDGKYLIHRTVITHIRPLAYYRAILDDTSGVDVEDVSAELAELASA